MSVKSDRRKRLWMKKTTNNNSRLDEVDETLIRLDQTKIKFDLQISKKIL